MIFLDSTDSSTNFENRGKVYTKNGPNLHNVHKVQYVHVHSIVYVVFSLLSKHGIRSIFHLICTIVRIVNYTKLYYMEYKKIYKNCNGNKMYTV